MSTYGLPNGAASQWESSGRARFHHNDTEGFGEKVTNMFTGGRKDSLPMYKDKPYNYSGPGGRRHLPPWARKKRTLGGVLAVLALLSWWFGVLSPLSWISSKSSGEASKTQSKGWFGGKEVVNWDERAERVKDAFKISWAGYEKYGWGYDEYHPVTHTGKQMTPQGLGWIIVDALDTMMLMNMTTELTHARQWVHSNLTYDQDHDVNTFETTIRMLGGLLSAHYLSVGFPGKFAPVQDDISDDIYVEKAADLADRLLSAYETQSGVPLASVNLHTYKGIPSHADAGASSTAEATSLQLEMKYLAKLTGESHYWEKAERVMRAVDDNQPADGLVPIFIYADRGTFRGDNIRFGSRGDSYYEYLIKQYLQTSQEEPVYQAMWNESMVGMKKHLITYSSPNNFTVLAERPNGLNKDLEAKMDHLVCFLPGTLALATTGGLPLSQVQKRPNWGEQQEEDMELARELTKTCMGMYHTESGLAPEIAHFNIHDPPLIYNDFKPKEKPKSPESFVKCKNTACTEKEEIGQDDYIFKPADKHNLQRPETVESLFYMWRITGDEIYRQWGWEMFQAFIKWTAVEDGEGFSSVSDVTKLPPPMRDNMESFWMAETLKYFYLLFSPNDLLPLNDVVFNTEAHPFPRFQMGKLFTTGWERKADRKEETPPLNDGDGHFKIQTIKVTHTVQQEVVAPETATATREVAEAAEAVVTQEVVA
ncbi:glycoside hydrolase family 47 protein [Zasmidium cellare ATCC 36951]|uniref:alpha-1,2-Mannosidase n=1 Tax=Zasmidium cellare ATCC 36951 TaxID=1080233 RepID=A0A6A6CP50_ZASCE|nr:glycoside hydrolase family 47 protein [Zasmidium cellare ATCC 36951]KAF2169047.1 glycoside hydrolase family 47 protein [Zasmidium cellare ATCC 36951]